MPDAHAAGSTLLMIYFGLKRGLTVNKWVAPFCRLDSRAALFTSIRPLTFVGETAGGKKYKSAKWADRLQTPEEKARVAAERAADAQRTLEEAKRLAAVRSRGMGTIVGG